MAFESFDHRVRHALLSAANQDEEDTAISTANSARMTDCWVAIARPAAEAQSDWNFRGQASDAKGATSG
jgi:hypothetical protein